MVIDSVVFVCIGNICRSPMAEALLRRHTAARGLDLACTSAGLGALSGRPADAHAISLMEARGIDISAHRARQFTPEIAAAHDLILVMEADHKRRIEAVLPAMRGRVYRLGEAADFDVPDPYGGDTTAFAEALRLIERGVLDWLPRLGLGGGRPAAARDS